jgi:hypothetical protein
MISAESCPPDRKRASRPPGRPGLLPSTNICVLSQVGRCSERGELGTSIRLSDASRGAHLQQTNRPADDQLLGGTGHLKDHLIHSLTMEAGHRVHPDPRRHNHEFLSLLLWEITPPRIRSTQADRILGIHVVRILLSGLLLSARLWRRISLVSKRKSVCSI